MEALKNWILSELTNEFITWDHLFFGEGGWILLSLFFLSSERNRLKSKFSLKAFALEYWDEFIVGLLGCPFVVAGAPELFDWVLVKKYQLVDSIEWNLFYTMIAGASSYAIISLIFDLGNRIYTFLKNKIKFITKLKADEND